MPPDLRRVEERLERVLATATGLLPEDQLRGMRERVAAGERGVALENFCTQLYEFDVSVPENLANELASCGERNRSRASRRPRAQGRDAA